MLKMIPGVNKYANFAYKMHKGASTIEVKNLNLYTMFFVQIGKIQQM